MRAVLALGALLLLASGCGGDGPGPGPEDRPGSVWVVNQSQYVLDELRIHQGQSYLAAKNELAEGPLDIERRVLFHLEGEHYFTVYREWYRGGPMRAITTADPVAIASETGYRLTVFDQSFRLEPDDYVAPVSTATTSTSSAGR